MTRDRRRAIVRAACAVVLTFFAVRSATAQDANGDGKHLGVASCAGNNCHGAVEPFKTSAVAQNEYLIWSQKDKHSRAFTVLQEERGRRIARNLGLPDAEHAELCLGCHTDNVPPARRGPKYLVADGVGCEACHGGASGWLGTHLSGAGHAANVAAGLYPTEQPLARAERCFSCHLGTDDHFVSHQILGAGHPRIGFELDTYTASQPAHYRVDQHYIERKGQPNDIQVWAVGQALDVKKRMDALLDPKHAPKGLQPELALFDCQACHHALDRLQWGPQRSAGLPAGSMRLYDATVLILGVIAARADPAMAPGLQAQQSALMRATGEGWEAVRREATTLQQTADRLVPRLAQHKFDRDDSIALAKGVVAIGAGGVDLHYSVAEQQTMALASIAAAMHRLGFADDQQMEVLNAALAALYSAVANDQTYRSETFVQALHQFEAGLPR